MSRRDPISVPWRVNRVRVLGPLEVYVIDEPAARSRTGGMCGCACGEGGACLGCGHPGCLERQLDLGTIRGFGDMAKAGFIALVTNLGKGCSEGELDRVMSPPGASTWVKRDAVHSHISAIRRAGLKVKHEAQRYRVVDLEPGQVDVLAFRTLREEIQTLEAAGTAAPAEVIQRCRAASRLWLEDPAEAHLYVHGGHLFASDRRWFIEIKDAHVRALLKGAPENGTLREAADVIDQLRQLGADATTLADLEGALAARRTNGGTQTPTAAAGPPPAAHDRPAWLAAYHEHLHMIEWIDLRPFGSEQLNSSRLEAVYTPLHVKPRYRDLPLPDDQSPAGRPSLDRAAQDHRALFIVGRSGSGKSTFLRHLCLQQLEEGGQRIPLFLELVELTEVAERELNERGKLPSDLIAQAFVAHLNGEGIPATVEDVERLSTTDAVLWLLDGLNEISVPEVRAAVADLISSCVRRWRSSRFVLTSTDGAVATHGNPMGFKRVDVDDFLPKDIELFLRRFAADFYRDDLPAEAIAERWEPLATKVRSSPDLRDLARVPLHLTAIAVIYFAEGWLPESRADLLQAAVSWSIRKRAQVLRPFIRRGRDLELVFAELAYRMVVDAEKPLAKAGKRWAAKQIAGLPLPALDGNVERSEDFVDVAVSTGGLLIPRGRGDLGMHEAIRDYLAASRIAGRTDDEADGWWSILSPHLNDPEWRHILTLVPGCLLQLGSDRVDLFFDRLGKSCIGKDRDVRAKRVALGGSVLRELILAGYRLGNVPRWHDAVRSLKELFDVETRLEPRVRHGAAVAYGLTGDDRLDDFEATWVALDGGRYWMGAQATDPNGRNYDPDASPWEPVRLVTVQPFAIRRYLITVQEFKEFVDAGAYSDSNAGWWTPESRQWRARRQIKAPLDWDEQLLIPNAPVTGVSWFECDAYCNWLTERADGKATYRLPYEWDWEFAARQGIADGMQFSWGRSMHVGEHAEANWIGAFLRHKTPVGLFPSSTTPAGVADLFGNVEEWCQDEWNEEEVQAPSSAIPPRLTRTAMERSAARHSPIGFGTRRVVRGGSCVRFSRLCRPTYRSRIREHRRSLTVGFRPIRRP